jgi:predicted  nucleic acid-binding Zn-ribbon protein
MKAMQEWLPDAPTGDELAAKAQRNIEQLFHLVPEKDYVYPLNQKQELINQVSQLQDELAYVKSQLKEAQESLKEFKADKEQSARLELLSLYN